MVGTGITTPTGTPGPVGIFAFGDLTDHLPESSAARLRRFRQHVADRRSLIPEFEQIRAVSEDRSACARRIEALVGHRSTGGHELADDDKRVTAERARHAKLDAEFKRLNALQSERTEEWRRSGYALVATEQYLKAGRPPGTQWEYVEPIAPKLLKGQTLREAVQVREDKAQQLRSDFRRISALPQPAALVRKRAREQIASIAALGAPSAARLMTGGDIAFAQARHQVPAQLVSGKDIALVGWEQADVFALTVYLNQDRLIADLDRQIDQASRDAEAMTPEQKEQALAAVAVEQLAMDREITELVFKTHSEGLSGIELRADTHPLAVLSLALVTVPRSEVEPGGSTPGYSWPLKR